MLKTWMRHIEVWVDDDDDEEDGGYYEHREILQGVVVPDCCKEVQEHVTVALAYAWDDMTDTPACTLDAPEGLSWNCTKENNWKSTMELWLAEQPEEVRSVTRFQVAKPRWSTGGAIDYKVLMQMYDSPVPDRPPPLFCPHCGTPLPEIERVPDEELPGPTHEPVADGDHCGTCEERSRNCTCMYPEVRWRTVPADPD